MGREYAKLDDIGKLSYGKMSRDDVARQPFLKEACVEALQSNAQRSFANLSKVCDAESVREFDLLVNILGLPGGLIIGPPVRMYILLNKKYHTIPIYIDTTV